MASGSDPRNIDFSLKTLFLYVHYPTDITGGIVVGIFSGYAAYWLAGMQGQTVS